MAKRRKLLAEQSRRTTTKNIYEKWAMSVLKQEDGNKTGR